MVFAASSRGNRRLVLGCALVLPYLSELASGFVRPVQVVSPLRLQPSAGNPPAGPSTPHLRNIDTFLSVEKSSSNVESSSTNDNDIGVVDWRQDEMTRFVVGWNDIVAGKAFDASNLSRLWTPHDFLGVASMLPITVESLRTAVTGQVESSSYVLCATAALLATLAHGKMYWDTPRDYRAPRLAEYRTIYEYSAVFNVAFAWLLLRVVPSTGGWVFPTVEALDLPACALLSGITMYGLGFAAYGKQLLSDANERGSEQVSNGKLLPSDTEYQGQAQLYLSGNVILNILAILFLPFTCTMLFRGTEWWERVITLHPSQQAFFGVSILVALLGNISGTLLLRLQELDIIKSQRAIVVVGVVSNVLLLLFPEILFHIGYSSGISEIGFYWE